MVDIDKTKEFYLTQEKIIDNCTCDDCRFYATEFIKEKLEIFEVISETGVDLEKNLKSEPTGVWCVRDEDGSLLFCQQVYQVTGKILPEGTSRLNYEKTEKGYKITVLFTQPSSDKIDIDLVIEREKTP